MIRQIMRLVLIVTVIAILIVIGVNRFAADATKETMNLSTQLLNVQQKEKVPSQSEEIDLYTKTEKTSTYKINTLTPVTKSETINKKIDEWMATEKQTFLDNIIDDSEAQASFKIDVTIEPESKHYDRLIFKTFKKEQDSEETQKEKIFNVDLESEEILSLDDFLNVNEETRQAILGYALNLIEQDEEVTISDNARQDILTSSNNWDWSMNQEGLTLRFDGSAITENVNVPMRITLPLQALYLHIHDNINQYVRLSDTQKEAMETAIKDEEERILAAEREQEKREQEKAATKEKEQSTDHPNGKYVALTFDDGPSSEVTPRVLDTLKKYDAKATFFMLGSQVDYYPEVAKQVADAGHEIGNHTEQHQDLTKLGPEGIRQEMNTTSDKINNATGIRPYLVRPPYGAYNDHVINDAANHGDSIILWSIDSLDWQSRDPDAINHEIQKTITSGSIVLMHDIHPTTADALPELMETLDQQGYQFVTVSQLLEMQGQNGVGPFYGHYK